MWYLNVIILWFLELDTSPPLLLTICLAQAAPEHMIFLSQPHSSQMPIYGCLPLYQTALFYCLVLDLRTSTSSFCPGYNTVVIHRFYLTTNHHIYLTCSMSTSWLGSSKHLQAIWIPLLVHTTFAQCTISKFAFCCCDKSLAKTNRRRKDFVSLHRLQFIIKSNQDRNSRQELNQRP